MLKNTPDNNEFVVELETNVLIYFFLAHNHSFATFHKNDFCDHPHKKGCFMSSASFLSMFFLSLYQF